MKNLIVLTLLILCDGFLFAQNNEAPNLATKSMFEVQVDAKKYKLEEGNELDIDGTLKNPKISIKLLDYKKFNAGGLSFEYPSNFSFEVDKSEGYQNWTLDGNDFVIMIIDIAGEAQVSDYIAEMIGQFGEENCTTKEIKSRLGEKILAGVKLDVALAGQRITIDFYKYSTAENTSKFITFQDTLEEDGTPTSEAAKTFKMINDSIQYK